MSERDLREEYKAKVEDLRKEYKAKRKALREIFDAQMSAAWEEYEALRLVAARRQLAGIDLGALQ